jgi:hypothetical protein
MFAEGRRSADVPCDDGEPSFPPDAKRVPTSGGSLPSLWPVAPMTFAEVLQVRDGQIVHSELINDAQELRAVIAAGA